MEGNVFTSKRVTKHEKMDAMRVAAYLTEPKGDPPRFHCTERDGCSFVSRKGLARHLKKRHLPKED
jgi:hypothetical protein